MLDWFLKDYPSHQRDSITQSGLKYQDFSLNMALAAETLDYRTVSVRVGLVLIYIIKGKPCRFVTGKIL